MAITVEGELKPGVTAKDIILAVIAKIGTGGGQGYVHARPRRLLFLLFHTVPSLAVLVSFLPLFRLTL
jgi:hypothetical protein